MVLQVMFGYFSNVWRPKGVALPLQLSGFRAARCPDEHETFLSVISWTQSRTTAPKLVDQLLRTVPLPCP
jgi:hypothetical protein